MDPKISCKCCLLRPSDKDLKKCYRRLDQIEVYSDMLKECFEIQLWASESQVEGGICEVCVMRLRDACDFKQQVQRSQQQLQTLQANVKKEAELKVKVKQEVINLDSDMEFMDDDFKTEPPDFEECELATSLALPRPDCVTVRRTRAVQKAHPSKAHRKPRLKITPLSSMKSLRPPEFRAQPEMLLRLPKAHERNVRTLIKNSNCTPFTNKTIAGIKCCYCQANFLSLALLKEHMQSAHTTDQYCGSNSGGSNNLSCKMDITDLKCKLCEKNFDVISSMKKHLIKEHDVKFYPEEKNYILEFKLSDGEVMNCALCSSTFETFKSLLQHMNRHYRNFICKECDMGFINKYKLTVHSKTHETGTFTCAFCPKVFPTNVKKMCHEKYSHRNGARYTTKCPHCDQSFTSYYQRNRHIIEDHNTTAATYKCNICDKSFIMKSKLTWHIKKVHLMERNHICPECGQGFFIKRSLEEHMIRHNGERIHKCTECHKAYARKKTLREHMRIHNNDRRFKCDLCGLAFVQKCSLKSHMLSNHGVTLAEFEKAKLASSD